MTAPAATVIHGDCLEVMAAMEAESVDAIVTDPPYGLSFMGQHWDRGVPNVDFWRAMFRVARPGAYLLSFGGTRTIHRITANIEDAGWVIRDLLVWAYASGYPKSRASLKPAWEPIVMARKPGGPPSGLNIDDCRIPFASDEDAAGAAAGLWGDGEGSWYAKPREGYVPVVPAKPGRWPANVLLTDPIFDGGFLGVVGGGESVSTVRTSEDRDEPGVTWSLGRSGVTPRGVADAGGYSRFFVIPKADASDREPVLGSLSGLDHVDRVAGVVGTTRRNYHPTVKPTELMRHLVRLVTPADGVVLDPFLGSGTTVLAAAEEGFGSVGIEREAGYVAIAEARLNGVQLGLGL
jgi:site-specific DNA-methyltransferase (adenine-specific)